MSGNISVKGKVIKDMTSAGNERTTRRSFVKGTVVMGMGLGMTKGNSSASKVIEDVAHDSKGFLSETTQKLLADYNLKYPIFQAAPGGQDLAIAVAKSGGMGAVALSFDSPDYAFKVVNRMINATNGNFYGNYVLSVPPKSLDRALEAGCPIIQFSWGIPSQDIVNKVRHGGAKLGIQVSSNLGAKKALSCDPDFLICQGIEAGGHVQGTSSLLESIEGILELAGPVPVLAAGGIANGQDIRQVLKAGAAGAVLGTRFMATRESDAHDDYKRELVEADADSTVYTICFDKEPTFATGTWNSAHRVLRNSTFIEWEAAGCPLSGSKPGETDVVATHPIYGETFRYETMSPVTGHEGSLEAMALYAGEGVGKVKDLPSADALLERLWKEFKATR